MACNGNGEDTGQVVAGLMAFVAAVVMILFLCWHWRCQRSIKTPKSTKLATSVTIRASFAFLLMALPHMIPGFKEKLPPTLLASYHWLPFWYVFVVVEHAGRYLALAWCCAGGFAFAVCGMSVLQYLMPGGAGPWGTDPRYLERGLLGGFNEEVAVVLSCIFAFGVFLSPMRVNMKKYGMACFSELLVHFLNPRQGVDDFEAVVWLYDFKPAWKGTTCCLMYILLLSTLLGALTLPWRKARISTCRRDAAQGYADLAQEMIRSLEQIIMHFREGTSAYALSSLDLYIRQLGTRLAELDSLLTEAEFEVRHSKLADMWRLSRVLRGCHQVFRILLNDLRELSHTSQGDSIQEITIHLDLFTTSFRDTLAALSEVEALLYGLRLKMMKKTVAVCAEDADKQLICALRQLEANGEPCYYLEQVFVESLRSFPQLFASYVNDEEPPRQPFWRYCLGQDWKSLVPTRKQTFTACRLSLGWILALLWSVYKRDHDATTVITAAWVWWESLGTIFELNMDRILGTAMGLVLGTVPAGVLPTAARHYVQDITLYLVVMFIMCAGFIYGYLAEGAKHSYGFKIAAAFGATQMVGFLPKCHDNVGIGEYVMSTNFMLMLDAFIACLLLMMVDVVFSLAVGSLTVQEVARVIPDCLVELGDIVGRFRKEDPANIDLSRLQQSIATARQLDQDSKAEDLIWSSLFAPPYNREFVPAILDALDVAFVSAEALRETGKRCGGADVPDLLTDLLPEKRAHWLHRYAVDARAALLQEIPIQTQESDYGESDFALHVEHQAKLKRVKTRAHLGDEGDAAALAAINVRALELCLAVRQLGALFNEHAMQHGGEGLENSETDRVFLSSVDDHHSPQCSSDESSDDGRKGSKNSRSRIEAALGGRLQSAGSGSRRGSRRLSGQQLGLLTVHDPGPRRMSQDGAQSSREAFGEREARGTSRTRGSENGGSVPPHRGSVCSSAGGPSVGNVFSYRRGSTTMASVLAYMHQASCDRMVEEPSEEDGEEDFPADVDKGKVNASVGPRMVPFPSLQSAAEPVMKKVRSMLPFPSIKGSSTQAGDAETAMKKVRSLGASSKYKKVAAGMSSSDLRGPSSGSEGEQPMICRASRSNSGMGTGPICAPMGQLCRQGSRETSPSRSGMAFQKTRSNASVAAVLASVKAGIGVQKTSSVRAATIGQQARDSSPDDYDFGSDAEVCFCDKAQSISEEEDPASQEFRVAATLSRRERLGKPEASSLKMAKVKSVHSPSRVTFGPRTEGLAAQRPPSPGGDVDALVDEEVESHVDILVVDEHDDDEVQLRSTATRSRPAPPAPGARFAEGARTQGGADADCSCAEV